MTTAHPYLAVDGPSPARSTPDYTPQSPTPGPSRAHPGNPRGGDLDPDLVLDDAPGAEEQARRCVTIDSCHGPSCHRVAELELVGGLLLCSACASPELEKRFSSPGAEVRDPTCGGGAALPLPAGQSRRPIVGAAENTGRGARPHSLGERA